MKKSGINKKNKEFEAVNSQESNKQLSTLGDSIIKFYLCSYSCCDKYIFDSTLNQTLPPLPPAPPFPTYKEGLFGIRKRVITTQDKMYERSKQMYRYIDYMTS